jgi:hypothetical protein
MLRRSDDHPVWRTLAAALAAFAVGVQLLLSALLITAHAGVPDDSGLAVICAHDQGAADQTAPGHAPAPNSHALCPACLCVQSGKLVPPLPAAPMLAVAPVGGQAPSPWRAASCVIHPFQTPYASRAPPSFA